MSVDPQDPAFAHLAAGQTQLVEVTFDIVDSDGAVVTQTETIAITGSNNVPVVDLNGSAAGIDAVIEIPHDKMPHALFTHASISDPDAGALITNMTISWTGAGLDILKFGSVDGIEVTTISNGIYLSGAMPASAYEAFLNKVTVHLHGSETPTFQVAVNHGADYSVPASLSVVSPLDSGGENPDQFVFANAFIVAPTNQHVATEAPWYFSPIHDNALSDLPAPAIDPQAHGSLMHLAGLETHVLNHATIAALHVNDFIIRT